MPVCLIDTEDSGKDSFDFLATNFFNDKVNEGMSAVVPIISKVPIHFAILAIVIIVIKRIMTEGSSFFIEVKLTDPRYRRIKLVCYDLI